MVSEYGDVIVSCGGGIINNKRNVDLLRGSDGLVVYLETSFEQIRARLGNVDDRPLFRDITKAQQLFDQRVARYREFGDLCVNTSEISAEEVCDIVVREVASRLSK
jgi:shikimate kinase